jgi:hypothetical protein
MLEDSARLRREATGISTTANGKANASTKSLPVFDGFTDASAWGAVVLIDRLVYPGPVTEAGLKLHVLSRGNPEQDVEEKLIVPL